MKTQQRMAALSVGLVAAAAVILIPLDRDAYELRFVVPSAAQVVDGGKVRIDGKDVGSVSDLDVRDGKAVITLSITDDDYVPLHEGTTSRIDWQSALGERIVTLHPGPDSRPSLPSGAMYEAESSQVEADQVLAALDEPTRKQLNSLLQELASTTKGSENDIRASLRAAGPAVEALGEILAAVGRDGPAIKTLVSELHQMTSGLAKRSGRISDTVESLSEFSGELGSKDDQLASMLKELPSTLTTARQTLDKVPAVADAAGPLLDDLQPSTSRLPAIADNLYPTLRDLRPVVARLGPTLSATQQLLGYTPELLDQGHQTLPALANTLDQLGPAAEFLRPYTPELVGFVTGFGATFSAYDAQGHGWTVLPVPGLASAGELPGAVPFASVDRRPAPGTSVGQPWTDANGGGIR
ncbi:MlaD family protein [Nocardioides sp. GCM10030258]|uniref:MlaD family protein n=1 Tax=unclassified Nocardioides TaxID=2615069 RepID=UPI0036136291